MNNGCIQDSLKMECIMDLVNYLYQTVNFMKECGKTINGVETEHIIFLTNWYIQENSKIICTMEEERYTLKKLVKVISVILKII